jgi:hypothetical protein
MTSCVCLLCVGLQFSLDPKWPNQDASKGPVTGLDFKTLFPTTGDATPHGTAFYYNFKVNMFAKLFSFVGD